MTKKRILSGMRPTGKLHLGHLVGALENWVALQEEYECYFMVADWHALMGEYENPQHMPQTVLDNVIDWMAAGVDPDKAVLFIQSQVPEHLELHLICSCFTPLGWLERCPTYKEQLREVTTRDLNTYAFLGYPVLQAADIMLYQAHKVPVGEDQLPHLELTREICRRFKGLYGSEVFPEPEAILTTTPRLPGIDGRKMSKSYNNAINLSDSPDQVREKVRSMITDPARVKLADKGHPDACNVYGYYGIFCPQRKAEVYEWCTQATVGCTECKKRFSDCLLEKLSPFHARRKALQDDLTLVQRILAEGGRKARDAAAVTMRQVREAMGI